MREFKGETVVGIDFDSEKIKLHQSMGRIVLYGDPIDADFWEKVEEGHSIELIMLALPNLEANLVEPPGEKYISRRETDQTVHNRELACNLIWNRELNGVF